MTGDPTVRDDLVQRYLDGDLGPEEARLVRDLMSSDPAFQADARAYMRIGELLREMSGAAEAEAGADASWVKVKEGIAPGAQARAADSGAGPSPSAVWISEVARNRKRFWIPAAGMLAAAASVAIVLAVGTAVDEVPSAIQEAAGLGSRVTDISLGAASTMVMEVDTGAGGTAAVLWVTDDEEEPAAREGGGQAGPGAGGPAGAQGKTQRI